LSRTPDLPLRDCGIAITRPADQAETLAELVRDAGGTPILFPLLAIAPLNDYAAFDAIVDRLDDFDWAFFISSNAVQHGIQRVLSRRQLPPRLRYAAVGPATAAQLQQFGVADVLIPADRFDSESLLNLAEMHDVAGKRCVVFRGVGGRELLADTLRQRGAQVEFAECYRRINPNPDARELTRMWQNGRLQAIVVTSSEALRNLLEIAGDKADWLRATPVFVNHARIAEYAREQGLQAITARTPGDAGMLEALADWRKEPNK
jgi:uroporphyrinogen-III synthase